MKRHQHDQLPLDIAPGGGAKETPYPDFDVASADKWALDWDDKTRRLLQKRLHEVPPYRFFTAAEVATLEALCARLIPQPERQPEQRVPIAPWIDERLQQGSGAGYRYEDMPEDGEAYRLGLAGFDQTAQVDFGRDFASLNQKQQDEVIAAVAAGQSAGKAWRQLPAQRFFQLLLGDVITNYYAHPAVWAEIGFNGPASPRGHMRLDLDKRDPWEAEEQQPRSSVALVRAALKRNRSEGGNSVGGATH
jgi:Gluconate 2-dehydrogenase subunit 3